MATTYNDIIRKRAGRAAYSLEEEKEGQWESFIPNEQFNSVLSTVLRSVRGNDIDVHKSFWIHGTYGTGKSHAAAVITHLLCDEVDAISNWVDYEYGDDKFKTIRDRIYAVRQNKRLLPVKIEGLREMTSAVDLPLVLQTAVVQALNANGIEIIVDTDFDTLLENIESAPVVWQDLIDTNSDLRSVAPDIKLLTTKLRGKDMGVFQKSRAALHSKNLHVFPKENTISDWLIEVQDKLRAQTPYNGLLILWDEFTDVMNDAIGIQVLKALQTIAQKFANEGNDSYFCLISHPSAFNKLGDEETKQTDGRYHRMKYNMEPVSAFKIMSRKFEIIDPERHEQMRNLFYAANGYLLDLYTRSSNNKEETRNDLQLLYPLHPGTANLATHYATVVGSSSRSVFEFIGQNEQMEEFLSSEDAFANRELVTADFLWDFVLKVFKEDVANYAAVTERFATYRQHVEDHSPAAFAIFKGVLLLNAFNNISGDSNNVGALVTPSEENIINLFTGTQYEGEVEDVLAWFNDQGIIQRDPMGIYSVQFSALPSHEIEGIKQSMMDGEYHYMSQVLHFGDTARSYFERKYLQKIIRPYCFEFYSSSYNDSYLRDSIKREKKKARTSDLFLALLLSRNNDEIAHLRQVADEASQASQQDDKELSDIIFIVFDTPFGDKEYNRFIEYMANYTAAQNHGFLEQVNVHREHAAEMIKEWLTNAQRGNATIYINGETIPMSVKHLSSTLNHIISPKVFPKGPDAIEIVRQRSPQTFWKPQVSKEIIRKVIFATTKTELDELQSAMAPFKFIIQDALDDNLNWRPDMPAGHPLRAVFDFINDRIKFANKLMLFNFPEKFEDLRRPPYGLSGNYASAGMVAFALRNWAGKIFDTLGKPRDANNLIDDITELFNVWEKGKSSNKLNFKFQTPEEGKLCKALVRLFRLDKQQGYNDVSSLKDARYAITASFLEDKGYPLWVLKYIDDDFASTHPALTINDDIRRLFDNIVDICNERDLKNPALVKETLELIENYKVDIPDYFSREGAFENGFNNFLLSQPIVDLQEDEIPDAYDYIGKHLQSTVGYWTEEEVADRLKNWRMTKNAEIEEERRRREEEERHWHAVQEQDKLEQERQEHEQLQTEVNRIKGDPEVVKRKKVTARQYIDSIDDPVRLRSLLDAVINVGYEQILDIILSNNKPDDNA